MAQVKQIFWGQLPRKTRRILVGLFLVDVLLLCLYWGLIYFFSYRDVPLLLNFPLAPSNDSDFQNMYLRFVNAGLDPVIFSLMRATYIPLLILSVVFLIRLLVSVGFLPFTFVQNLDERQQLNRNRAYQISFWATCFLGLAYLLFLTALSRQANQEGTEEAFIVDPDGTKTIILAKGMGLWVQQSTFSNYLDLTTVVFRIFLVAFIAVPILVTAWTESEPISQEIQIEKLAGYANR
jgi:hypothetical protein